MYFDQFLHEKKKNQKHAKGPFTPYVSVNAAMTLAILFSLKTVESLENGLQTILEPLYCFQ